MICIWIYLFKDGTKLELLNNGLSLAEIWKLEEIHGELTETDHREGY